MKRISLVLLIAGLGVGMTGQAQDAATEERLNKLSGQLEDLIARQNSLQKQMESLAKEVDSLREQAARPTVNYAAQDDLKRVAEAVKEVDRKRLDDYEKIRDELKKIGRTIVSSPAPVRKQGGADASTEKPSGSDKGYEYIVQKGDTLSVIVQAYRDKNIKVTTEQILKANPGLKPERMHVGQKIFIPAP